MILLHHRYLSITITTLVLLLVLVLVIFFLSPRDPELAFKSATGVSLSFAPFKLSLKVRPGLFARPR